MRVLIALDGSTIAERAAAAVAAWAPEVKPKIWLVSILHPDEVHSTPAPTGFSHVVTPAATVTGTPLGRGEPFPRLAEDRSQALARATTEREDYLHSVAKRYLAGCEVVVLVEPSEDTAGSLVRLADELQADLLAMGTHGRSGIRRVVMGSVAERTVREAHVPVTLVGPATRAA